MYINNRTHSIIKKLLCCLYLFVLLHKVSATTGYWSCNEYSLTVSYNKYTAQGDAIFIRLSITDSSIPATWNHENTKGTAELFKTTEPNSITGKDISRTEFFYDNADAKQINLIAGIPISTSQKTGSYTLQITYEPFGMSAMRFSIPVILVPKTFSIETISLDTKNTALRTDNGKKRTTQINHLNTILTTIDKTAVYETHAFIFPTAATRRTAFFGDRRVYEYSTGTTAKVIHYGIDYGIPTGSTVVSCGTGKVVLAENRISTGWSICIEHLPGLYSLYYHLNSIVVQEGQIVHQGMLIGYSGCTGLATGPHLHWEIRLRGEAVNPDFFIGNFTFEPAIKTHQNQ
jgi:murein DD-endopeptidase MepM/ murein hydrolase activator NlpD